MPSRRRTRARTRTDRSIARRRSRTDRSRARASSLSTEETDPIVAFARASIDDDVDVDATRARDDTNVSPRMSHRSLALERDVRRLARVDDDASRYPETRHDDARANAIPTRRERRTNERTNEGSPGRHVHRDRAARVGDGDEGARARGLETEGRARESRGANERCGRESASGEDAIVDRRRLFVGRRERAGARAGADGRGRGEGEGRDADGDADGETARGKVPPGPLPRPPLRVAAGLGAFGALESTYLAVQKLTGGEVACPVGGCQTPAE